MRIDPAAVTVWRITGGILSFMLAAAMAVVLVVKLKYVEWIPWWLIGVVFLLFIIQLIWMVLLRPNIAYRTFHYQLGDADLMIEKGIWFKQKAVLPFVRIQNVETSVGPIMKRFRLKSLVITTAGGSETIELLNEQVAEQLKQEITLIIKQYERRNDR